MNAEATPEGLAAVSRSSVVNGLPDSYYNRDYADRINKVTVEDLQRVADKWGICFVRWLFVGNIAHLRAFTSFLATWWLSTTTTTPSYPSAATRRR